MTVAPPETAPATPQNPQAAKRAALVAMLAAVLGSAAGAGVTSMAVSVLTRAGYAPGIATAVVNTNLTWMDWPALGTAARLSLNAEGGYEAAFLVNSLDRVVAAIKTGTPLEDALAAEKVNVLRYQEAASGRRDAAVAVDQVAAQAGPPGSPALALAWKATLDAKTTPACRAADGRIFLVNRPPLGLGYPGSTHGRRCRCVARPPTSADWKRGRVSDSLGLHDEGA